MKEGWNTWNVRSVLSHVHLPDGMAISLGLIEYGSGQCLREALIGRKEEGVEDILPGPHAYDGSYTCLTLTWNSAKVRVETAVEDDHWFALVTPLATMLPGAVAGSMLQVRPWYGKTTVDPQASREPQRPESARTMPPGSPLPRIASSMRSSLACSSPNSPLQTRSYWVDSSFMVV